MKDQTQLKSITIHKSNTYTFFIEGVECSIIETNNTFYSYVNEMWLENKDGLLKEAVENILKHIGIGKEIRKNLKINIVSANPD